jgi:UDP-glucose:(heptosyl)LPS alpha-1,3-glucosyltransferase
VLSPKQWVQGYIENAPYKKRAFKKIVAISDMVKNDIIRWYAIPENQIEVVYNGVDTERFHPRNRQYREEIRKRHGIGDEFVILFVSNNFRMKGLGYLIKALAEIKKENHLPIKLLILGRDRQRPYLRLARKMGISEDVVFAGSTDEPEKYYRAADLLVHPTFYDACSLTVLEALSSGLPVITTTSNGAGGILMNGQGGIILSGPRDNPSLCENLSFFLEQGIRERASIEARRLAENYSLERNWRKMKEIINRVFEK